MSVTYLIEDAGSLGSWDAGTNVNLTTSPNDLDQSTYNKEDTLLEPEKEEESQVMNYLDTNGVPETDQETVLTYLQKLVSVDNDSLSDLKPQEIKRLTIEFVESIGYEPVDLESITEILGESLIKKLIDRKEIVKVFNKFFVRL